MKLSKKGFEKILDTCLFDEDRATYTLNFSSPKKDYYFEIQETDFEPDDFQGTVILTVEEAKEILKDYVDTICCVAKQCGYHEVRIAHPESIDSLLMRIEQAEKP